MDIVTIFNGLGNQMSQYAFYLQKKSIHKNTFFLNVCNEKNHNGYELEKVFNIFNSSSKLQRYFFYLIYRGLMAENHSSISKPLKKILNLLGCHIVKENYDYTFKAEYLKRAKGIKLYYGGWHDERFFIQNKKEILGKFKFGIPEDTANLLYIDQIKTTNSIAIHVRQGDYLNNDNIHLFGNVCGKKYFEEAIKLISQKVEKPHFFVFSNDMSWVHSNLHFESVTYVTCNQQKDSWKDMYLMTLCKHNIISNSTFSWWGAWLNQHLEKIVIAPDRFLKNDKNSDIYPDSWIKILTN